MFYNYLKVALRNLRRNKVSSFINIVGLVVGMAVAMLIGLWIHDELSFNKYHQNYARIAQVMRHFTMEGRKETGGQSNPMPLSGELRSAFGSDFIHLILSTKPIELIIAGNDKSFTQSGRFMEPGAPEMLTLHMRQGSQTGLQDRNSILLSETLAQKLFGDSDPMNKILTIDAQVTVKVTGVYEDLPHHSEFRELTFIAPFDLYASFNPWVENERQNWAGNNFPLYAQITAHTTFDQVSKKIKNIMLPHLDEERAAQKPEVFLHPMSKWHLYSEFENGVNIRSEPMKFIWFYGIIGGFVLVLACINFINLSTARSQKRAKEVGIRKTIGSVRAQLVSQFLSESLLIAALAFIGCLGLVRLVLPWFNKITGKEVTLLWADPLFWGLAITFTVITALMAGSYPAFYLSSLQPVKVLKGTFQGGNSGAVFRKLLVVFQFTISIALIIGTSFVYRQILFSKNRPAGYERAGLLTFPKKGLQGKEDVFRSELLQTGVVAEVAESASKLTDVDSNNTGFDWPGKVPGTDDDFGTLGVSYEYGSTIGWQFVAGRDFSREFLSDSAGLVVNEAAVKFMGLKNPVGEIVRSEYWHQGNFKILGVVKDMVMESPFEPARPTIFSLRGNKNWLFVKINPQVSAHEALPKIEAVFKKIIASVPFNYQFLDEEYAAKFKSEEQIGTLAGGFAALSIFISCLGLFGLASYTTEQRTKEIGIRKVLGATAFSLWRLLSKDFVFLIIISLLIAAPVAYYFLAQWLQHYTYRTYLSGWVFVLAGGIVLVIALLTVSFQAVKASCANPVESLRNE